MSKDTDAIDQVFQLHEEAKRERTQSQKLDQIRVGTSRLTREEQAWADEEEAEAQDGPMTAYHPIQRREDSGTGCLGSMLYTAFVVCVSIILACLGWMAASDMLALNKDNYTATIVLPDSIFETEVVDVTDEEGSVTGHTTVRRADVSYLSSTLKQAGLIEYRWLFEFYCRIAHADEKVRPGEYHLQSTYDYRALIQNMRPNAGSATTVNVTLIEGMTMHEMFVTLERSGVSSYEDLMEAAKNYHFNYSFIANNDDDEENDPLRLEGFLFPDTYNFYTNMQASSAINKFLEQFNNNLTDDTLTRIQESGRSLRDIVNIASMIEKEAADDEERADIASVIYNRLRADMVLGIDATILYIHPEHEGAPNEEMLKEKSPYNTRRSAGLPPTPICNPGLASLRAALSPNQTDYYYYALDTDTGRHRFFTNEDEFNAFVATQNY
ncbi:MAG: endolytic transglycosylase MltG [Oscillospiraceae bacterium]|nr:endolytic transglycosylase MltG [Oscillospiraceae bacterium]